MTEILPKPRREDFMTHSVSGTEFDDISFTEAELAYYKRLAEFACEALEKSVKSLAKTVNDDIDTIDSTIQQMEAALSTIKGSQS